MECGQIIVDTAIADNAHDVARRRARQRLTDCGVIPFECRVKRPSLLVHDDRAAQRHRAEPEIVDATRCAVGVAIEFRGCRAGRPHVAQSAACNGIRLEAHAQIIRTLTASTKTSVDEFGVILVVSARRHP